MSDKMTNFEGTTVLYSALTAGLAAFLATIILYIFNNFSKYQLWKKQGVKGPNPWLVFPSFIWSLFTNKERYKEDLINIRKYGTVYGFTDGERMLLMIADKEALKDVLVRNFNHFMDRRRPAMTKYFGKFLTQLCGQEWKQTRSIMSPTFTSGKMKAMVHLMNDCLDPMMKRN